MAVTLLAALPPMDASSSASNIFPMPQTPASPSRPAAALPSSSLALSTYSSPALRHAHMTSITSFPILLLTVLGILAAAVILLAYYVFVIRCCLTWHRDRAAASSDLILSRRGLRPQRTTARADADAGPRGLQDAAIRALPAFSYRKKKPAAAFTDTEPPSAPASECAVCLGELEEGDTVRMLPACLHVFHLACVDAWLQGSASCPICRADVAATLCRLLLPSAPPMPEEEEVVVDIQVVVVPEEDGQGTMARRQREATVAPAPAAEVQGEGTGTDEKTKSTVNVVPPRRSLSLSMDGGGAMAAGGEVHLQIQSILHRECHYPRDDHHDSDSSGSGRV